MTPDHLYRHQSLGDLTQRVAEPLVRDRIAIARPAKDQPGLLTDIAGLAIWASVSEEADAKIREQIKAGTFPVRLKPEDWQSGSVNWLLDGEARAATGPRRGAERAGPEDGGPGDRQLRLRLVKTGELRLHPQIGGLVEKELLEKMGGQRGPVAGTS